MTTSRTEDYLSTVLASRGQWVKIKTRRTQTSRKSNKAERREIMQTITTSLKLMGIPYEIKERTSYTIRTMEGK